MGIYDRDYFRQERPGWRLAGSRSAVIILIGLNVVVFVAENLVVEQGALVNLLSAHVDTLAHPWLWWQFVTYGFVHDPGSIQHVLFNMLTLWFLGRDVEDWYGTREFVRIYLALLVFGSVIWAGLNYFDRNVPLGRPLIGASGAVTGVVILYALNFPRRTLLLMFVLPVPAWVVGILAVAYDLLGQTGQLHNAIPIAYSVHLAGAAGAFLYFRLHWNFGRLWAGFAHWSRLDRRPALRVHRPERPAAVPEDEVDRILEKIHREGESHLTRQERRLLENASRQYQQRRRGEG